MFNVKPPDAKELLRYVIACQQVDFYGDGIINTTGLRLASVPEVHEPPKYDWTSENPNDWRHKRCMFFDSLFK